MGEEQTWVFNANHLIKPNDTWRRGLISRQTIMRVGESYERSRDLG